MTSKTRLPSLDGRWGRMQTQAAIIPPGSCCNSNSVNRDRIKRSALVYRMDAWLISPGSSTSDSLYEENNALREESNTLTEQLDAVSQHVAIVFVTGPRGSPMYCSGVDHFRIFDLEHFVVFVVRALTNFFAQNFISETLHMHTLFPMLIKFCVRTSTAIFMRMEPISSTLSLSFIIIPRPFALSSCLKFPRRTAAVDLKRRRFGPSQRQFVFRITVILSTSEFILAD